MKWRKIIMAGTTITINMDAEVVRELKKLASNEKQKKGFLGRTITLATKKWLEERKQQQITKEMMALMEKGFDMGELKIKHRSGLYDRRY